MEDAWVKYGAWRQRSLGQGYLRDKIWVLSWGLLWAKVVGGLMGLRSVLHSEEAIQESENSILYKFFVLLG